MKIFREIEKYIELSDVEKKIIILPDLGFNLFASFISLGLGNLLK